MQLETGGKRGRKFLVRSGSRSSVGRIAGVFLVKCLALYLQRSREYLYEDGQRLSTGGPSINQVYTLSWLVRSLLKRLKHCTRWSQEVTGICHSDRLLVAFMFFLPGAQQSHSLPLFKNLLIKGPYAPSSPIHLCISHLHEAHATKILLLTPSREAFATALQDFNDGWLVKNGATCAYARLLSKLDILYECIALINGLTSKPYTLRDAVIHLLLLIGYCSLRLSSLCRTLETASWLCCRIFRL